ncbi:transglycosylase domain-containing protein [Xanthomonas bonasiae]|uniref:transglycosylase domain-containing protein n=1 Tax=Xanthomonas bonasiae TaxID=2810351 RepID=UPI001782F92F|nr:transglycosylase domain-containing protein [Xanthomonas surreyensis]MBD7922671.1 transglycosylase domain-containing protein [Xanthomonas surreyensis]
MKSIALSTLKSVAALLLASIAAIAAYDVLAFQPRQMEIRALLNRVPPEDRDPPASIRRYIDAAHRSTYPPSTAVARLLLARLGTPRHENALSWHVRVVVWDLLVSLHLSQDQILALYSTLSYNGVGHGISQLSQKLYAKPASALSDAEAATVVAILWAPGLYLHDKSRLERRRDLLLARAQTRH